ncbi:phytanoyl-CoA dioxygenase family protein [Candidatus Protochlamydia amoebophila]|uniref:Uncharacterized protein n=1 Tax=Protochlamydia amoebophila (strain UWE25) TaxID=264201 RepID=A0A2P9H9D4_PARUW|nr:phytanoyl-CoA dioxygenase family protein [Candidatus Protochlamydia amoebophila]SPJ31602.1 unnamed protein product [Candidatus Protochlamydia amoebophila UWE25]
MKFAIAKEHRDFFQKNGLIEFEDFLSEEQVSTVNRAIDRVLTERLKVTPQRLKLLSSECVFSQGRDLWRSNEELKKIVCQPKFAEIASELIEKKPLRLGYDQLFPAHYQTKFSSKQQRIYAQFLEQTLSLESISGVSGVLCGLMICLGEKGELFSQEQFSIEGIDIYSRQAGHAIYFNPNALVNWRNFYAHSAYRYFLIVYTQNHSHYQLQVSDPHTHFLKQLGYVFNDKLNDRLHPIVYR